MPEPSASTPNDAREPALVVEDLTVRFGARTIVDRLGFEVPRGQALAILGPNGSGKTVLLKALVGALPHEGRVRWAEGTRIGYVPQKLDLERDLPVSGDDLLRAKASVARVPRSESSEALALVGLSPALSRLPIGALSGGQFQRLLLAVALVGAPTVLLLDEPTAGVDEPGQQTLYELLDHLRDERGMTTILISHDLSVVFRHADRVLCLARGRGCFGPPKTVLTPERLQDLYGTPVGFHVHEHEEHDVRS